MGWTKLSQTSAFAAGSPLWLLPSVDASVWTRKTDWYLNLQISKSKSHEPKTWSPEIQKIVEENEIDLKPPVFSKKAPLLVSPSRSMPFHQIIEVPFDGKFANWVHSCERIWVEFGKPAVRIFLPPGISSEELQSVSPVFQEADELTYLETDKGNKA